jgi:hypothetical protein
MGKDSLYLASEKVRDIVDTSHSDAIALAYTATETATSSLASSPHCPLTFGL